MLSSFEFRALQIEFLSTKGEQGLCDIELKVFNPHEMIIPEDSGAVSPAASPMH